MHRRDYELIAETIASFPDDISRPVARVFAENLAGHRGNESFDREKFLAACGVETEPA